MKPQVLLWVWCLLSLAWGPGAAWGAPPRVRADAPDEDILRVLGGEDVTAFLLRELYALRPEHEDTAFARELRALGTDSVRVERWRTRQDGTHWMVVLLSHTYPMGSVATKCQYIAAFGGPSEEHLEVRATMRFCAGGRTFHGMESVAARKPSGEPVLAVRYATSCEPEACPDQRSWYVVRNGKFVALPRAPRMRPLPVEPRPEESRTP